jgi:hypothetical protein
MNREIDSISRHDIERGRTNPPEESRSPEVVSRERRPLVSRTYAYCLSQAELETMKDIGRFRTIAVDDLARHRYQDNRDQMRADLRALQDQGLVQRRTIWTGKQGDRLTVFVITKRGKALLEHEGKQANEQRIYAGFVKPAEVHHDAAIYRMYQVEANKIEHAGGRVRRVVLDYELKQKVYQPLAKARAKTNALSPSDYSRRQVEIASQNKLKVVHGKILLPDLRIEYDTASGELAHVDLELATHHYRGSSMRAKAEAGFKMYAPQDSVAHLTAAFDPELTAEIFSF